MTNDECKKWGHVNFAHHLDVNDLSFHDYPFKARSYFTTDGQSAEKQCGEAGQRRGWSTCLTCVPPRYFSVDRSLVENY